jgi:hypothetical protein
VLGVRLQLAAARDTIIADGSSQAALSVKLQRSDGVPIANAEVRLETTLGTLSSSVVETDVRGEAEAILIAGTKEGKALVSASYGEGLREQVAVAMIKGPPASIVLVSVEPPAIGVRGAGDNETAVVTFEVRDAWGNTVADGQTVVFRVEPGPLSSASGRVGPDSTTTVAGRVRAAVSSDTLAGTVMLFAEARSVAAGDGLIHSEPVPIAIHGGHPDQIHFSVAPKPVNLAGRVLFGLESKVTAYVYDKYSNPVPNGTAVHFETTGGGVEGSGLTEVGQASVRLFTAKPIPSESDDHFAQVFA